MIVMGRKGTPGLLNWNKIITIPSIQLDSTDLPHIIKNTLLEGLKTLYSENKHETGNGSRICPTLKTSGTSPFAIATHFKVPRWPSFWTSLWVLQKLWYVNTCLPRPKHNQQIMSHWLSTLFYQKCWDGILPGKYQHIPCRVLRFFCCTLVGKYLEYKELEESTRLT